MITYVRAVSQLHGLDIIRAGVNTTHHALIVAKAFRNARESSKFMLPMQRAHKKMAKPATKLITRYSFFPAIGVIAAAFARSAIAYSSVVSSS